MAEQLSLDVPPSDPLALPETFMQAIVSDCGRYRYRLTRRWSLHPTCLFVMLNPSTADASVDDPTIRRCIGFAKREGHGGIEVVNLFAYRATKPAELLNAAADGIDVVGPNNLKHLTTMLKTHLYAVAAWGASPAAAAQVPALVALAAQARTELRCLGVTADGSPRHPLYVRSDAPLIPWTRIGGSGG